MSTMLITGGSGMIGSVLTSMLVQQGHRVIILSRTPKQGDSPQVSGAHWDPDKGVIDEEAVRRADYIIHLAGAGVADKRWTDARKKEIVESRTKSSALVVKALQEIPNHIKAVISSSAIGWYGEDPSIPNPQPFEETAPPDDDFLGETCRLWEQSIAPVKGLGQRLVIIRTGVVFGKKGGALEEFRKPARLGMAAILGSGKQVMSWIHVEDLCRLYMQAADDDRWSGVYNGVAPQPENNRTITLQLARRLKGKYFVPVYVPSFVLKLALGGLSIEVLKSATVSSKKVKQMGFQYLYPSLEAALDNLI